MIITDYLRPTPDPTWYIARECGVKAATIRLPEDNFDVTDRAQITDVMKKFSAFGFVPTIVEPLPNELHDHIKLGDKERDACIEKFIALLKNLHETTVNTICFNFMAHYGWTRTSSDIPERGNARVTGFRISGFRDDGFSLPAEKVWKNYEYFIKAVIPYAEKYEIKLALHPDDPPISSLGKVGRIFTSLESIKKGISIVNSDFLGVTFCQACYHLMGENLENAVTALANKIFFIHFRNVAGTKTDFRETFHDNGEISMADVMKIYRDHGIDCPIRVDHVPTMSGEKKDVPGYDALGRLFAIGYLKGILESTFGEKFR